MGRKVYHVWNYTNGIEGYLGSFTSRKKGREFAIASHEENKNVDGYTMTVLSVYSFESREHWDIWFSDMIKENKEVS